MKKLLFLLCSLFVTWGYAQSMLQPNYHTYLSNSNNQSGVSLQGEYPYFGIGRQQLLTQLPYFFSKGGMIDYTPFLGSSVFGLVRPYTYSPNHSTKGNIGVYASSFREWEASANASLYKGGIDNTIMASYAQNQYKIDRNEDSWLDLPLQKRVFIMGKSGINLYRNQLSVRAFYLRNKVQDGEFAYESNTPNSGYGFGNTMNHVGTTIKFKHRLKKNHENRSSSELLVQVDGVEHNRSDFFGLSNYTGTQREVHTQVGYTLKENNNNRLFLGTNFDYIDVSEQFANHIDYARIERSVGLLARYEDHLSKHLYVAANMEVGQHNLQKTYIRPSLKVNLLFPKISELQIILYGAYDWRYPSLFSDFRQLFTSSYFITIDPDVQPNKATQLGIGGTHTFYPSVVFSQTSIKFNYNYFHYHQKNVFSLSPVSNKLTLYHTTERAYKSLLEVRAQGRFSNIGELSLGLSYRWDNARFTYRNELVSEFFLPKHNFYTSLIYNRSNLNLSLKLNYHVHSPQQFPDLSTTSPWLHRLDFRAEYQLKNLRHKKLLKDFSFLAGIDNMLGQQQDLGVFSPPNIWGTRYRTRAFLGIEYKLQ